MVHIYDVYIEWHKKENRNYSLNNLMHLFDFLFCLRVKQILRNHIYTVSIYIIAFRVLRKSFLGNLLNSILNDQFILFLFDNVAADAPHILV